jgi:H2-forming N5,N10-methylenetetrahydromethanopterin dehydrogenase-like enzyme
MEHMKTDGLLKMLNKAADILKNNKDLNSNERQEVLDIIRKILEELNNDSELSFGNRRFIENIVHEMDVLKPLSYMHVKTVPFFICKSWVRFR